MSLLKTNEIQVFNGTTVTITAPAVVSANDNTNAALRITQTGTGNALVVEDDSGNPDSTPVVVDNVGRLVAGHTASVPTHTNVNAPIQLHTNIASSFYSSIASANWVANAQGASVQLSKSRSGTIGTHTVVNSSDTIAEIHFDGSDGTQFIEAAKISAFVDGTPGTNDMPGRLIFSTTADGASSPTERMRIDSSGNVGIGTTSPSQKLDVTGNINATGTLTLGTALAVAEGGTGVASLGSLDAADLGSGAATDGYVLTADGAGNAAWEAASGGGGGVADGDKGDITVSSSGAVWTIDNAVVTNAKLSLSANDSNIKTALNASGDAPIYACRAWVNFNGSGTVAIRASGNVSSFTDNGTGDFTVNFTTAMPDANYGYALSAGGGLTNIVVSIQDNTRLTTKVDLMCRRNDTNAAVDSLECAATFFR